MALTVENAPRYTGNISTGNAPAQSINSVENASGGGQMNTYNPQTPTLAPVQGSTSAPSSGGYVMGSTSNYQTGPTAAQAAETARINGYRNSAGIRQDGLFAGARTSIRDNRNTFQNEGQALTNEIQQGQQGINTGRANNALNLRRSMAAIAGGVRQGMRSGGVDLANMNALDSGASDALARAWARAGGQQSSGVQNEAALAEQQFTDAQTNLDNSESQGLANLSQWRETETARVSDKLYNSLRELEAEAAAEGINDIVQMQMRDQIISEASAELEGLENATRAEIAKIKGLTPDQVQARAFEMEQAGTQTGNPFAIESVGQGRQMRGAPIGQFNTRPRMREEGTPAYNPFVEEEQVRV